VALTGWCHHALYCDVCEDGAAAPIMLTYSDRFCLDGKLLRLTSSENLSTYGQAGTTYQTEVADFSNLRPLQPQGRVLRLSRFRERMASPTIMALSGSGYGANAQVLANGSTTASEWLLSKVSDRAGNSMLINYTVGVGVGIPLSISWQGGSAIASVLPIARCLQKVQ